MRIESLVRQKAWNVCGSRRLKVRVRNSELWEKLARCNLGIAALRADGDRLSAQVSDLVERQPRPCDKVERIDTQDSNASQVLMRIWHLVGSSRECRVTDTGSSQGRISMTGFQRVNRSNCARALNRRRKSS